MIRIYLVALTTLCFIVSCGENRRQMEVTQHPEPDRIPYSDFTPELLQVNDLTSEELDQFPESIRTFYNYLTGSIEIDQNNQLDLLTTDRIDVVSKDHSTVLILERDNNRLLEYDLSDESYTVLASQGRGPGDILFAQELTFHDGKAYVAMQGFQISVFDCRQVICEYEKTIPTKHNNYSVSSNGEVLFYLGLAPFGGDNPHTSANQNLIYKIDMDGNVQNSFMPVYNFKAPVVRDALSSGGKVRSLPDLGKTIVTIDHYPYLFIYDEEQELIEKYELPELIQPLYEYEERNDSGEWTSGEVYKSNSKISELTVLDQKWLFMRIKEERGVEFISLVDGFDGCEWHSYYLFDVEASKLYKVGDDVEFPIYQGRNIHVTKSGVVLNVKGSLTLIKI